MKNLNIAFYGVTLLTLGACGDHSSPTPSNQFSPLSCRGIYYTTSANGATQKWDQYWQSDQGLCLTDELALSDWEQSLLNWTLNGLTCKPQPQIQSQSLVASGNFYRYRDNKVYLDLNTATGVFRRLVYGEDKDGSPLFTKLQGCFYIRNDSPNGNQLLLDTVIDASSESFDPVEVFYYTQTASGLDLVRYDQSSDWTYTFCPADSVPVGFCDLLRNGNLMFWPTLTSAQQATMLNEAILIRKTYNYSTITSVSFASAWSTVATTRTESSRDDFKYTVIPNVDTPLYISDAWRSYVMGTSNTMPDTSSSEIPPICYDGSPLVNLVNGNPAKVSGEICYENGQYSFTQ